MAKAGRVLIIEPDPAVRAALLAALPAEQWTAESASDSAEGLDHARRAHFDVVIADLDAASPGDFSLLRSWRAVDDTTKVVVIATRSAPEGVIRALREHAFAFLSKPVSPAAVREVVGRALKTPGWQDGIEVLSSRPEWIALRLRCRAVTADRLTQFVRELEADLPLEEREQLETAFRELLLNAIEHGGGLDPDQKVYVQRVRTSRCVIYTIRDPGRGFSLENLPHAAVSNPADDPMRHAEIRAGMKLRPGGFGILLARSLADDVVYNDEGNEVVLVKYLPVSVDGPSPTRPDPRKRPVAGRTWWSSTSWKRFPCPSPRSASPRPLPHRLRWKPGGGRRAGSSGRDCSGWVLTWTAAWSRGIRPRRS